MINAYYKCMHARIYTYIYSFICLFTYVSNLSIYYLCVYLLLYMYIYIYMCVCA